MSTFRNPVGPQPSSVYWRRRIIVGLALLAVIVVVLLILFQPRGGTPTTPTVTKTNTPTTAAPSSPDAACAAGAVEITAATDKSSYAAGEKPQITLTVTNRGSAPCTINAGTTQQEYRITSGSELYWDSKDCQSAATDAPVILEPNVPKSTAPIVWDRTRSSATTCTSDRAQVPAGGASYHLNITLGTLKSNDVQFILE
ncbi:MAG TPA: hypothetical protein PJ998_11565 [Terrimesophilobacter sp.]|nr:hypothetical protein [Terrimesophilobacter sp.]